MSVLWSSRAWASPVPVDARERLMLLALADNANDAGVCWPGVPTLRRKCGLATDRGTRDVLARVLARATGDAFTPGAVTVHADRRDGRTNVYHLRLTPDRADRADRGDRMADRRDRGTPEGADRGAPDGADRGPLTVRTAEPSENHQLNHQQQASRARATASGETTTSNDPSGLDAAAALMEEGVSEEVARSVVAKHGAAHVWRQLALLVRLRVAKKGPHSPAAWLVRACADDYAGDRTAAVTHAASVDFTRDEVLTELARRGVALSALNPMTRYVDMVRQADGSVRFRIKADALAPHARPVGLGSVPEVAR